MAKPSPTALGAAGSGCFASGRRAPLNHGDVHRLSAAGVGVQNIAQQLGGSMEDVRRILAPKPANDAQPTPTAPEAAAPAPSFEDRLTAMWNAGLPIRAICARLGATPTAIQDKRRRLGLPNRGNVG